ncbi:acyltransferase [Rhabdothermincola salaria]|uniref:acyltransferase n=1 Tax=Rhabdothermincola salaria TaxID=2903142 RepID=UPI001E48F68E|nr:acyltransferase [Rhabdothermincola salaria]
MPLADPLRHAVDRVASAAVQGGWRVARRFGKTKAGSPGARRFGAFGDGSSLAFPPGEVIGPQAIRIGARCAIGAEVTLAAGFPDQVFPPVCDPVITLGDRVTIGRGGFVVGLASIHLEDDVTIAPNVYITDHNHTYTDLWLPIGEQWPEQADVRIGAGSWLGTGVIVLPGAQIGRHVTVAGGAVVRGVVPDHCVVAGAPARVVRRWTEADGWVPPLAREVEVPPGWPVGVPPER